MRNVTRTGIHRQAAVCLARVVARGWVGSRQPLLDLEVSTSSRSPGGHGGRRVGRSYRPVLFRRRNYCPPPASRSQRPRRKHRIRAAVAHVGFGGLIDRGSSRPAVKIAAVDRDGVARLCPDPFTCTRRDPAVRGDEG